MTDSYNPVLEELEQREQAAAEEYEAYQAAQAEVEREEQAAAQERNMQQKQEALEANIAEAEQQQTGEERSIANTGIPGYEHPGVSIEAMGNTGREVAEGLIDTALGLGSMAEKFPATPWLGNPISMLQDKWDKANPISQDEPMHAMIRKISGIAIPAMYGGGLLSGAARSTAIWGTLGGKTKLAADVGMHLGVDTVVTTASTSATDETMATVLNDNFGAQIPWGTKTTDSTEVKYWKQMFETAGLSIAGDLLGVIFGFLAKTGKGTKYVAEGDAGIELLAKRAARNDVLAEEATKSPALKAIDDQIEELGSLGDELTSKGEETLRQLTIERGRIEVDELPFDGITDPEVSKYLNKLDLDDEALRRLEADPQGLKGHDPFTQQPSNPVSTAIPHPKSDPIEAVVDITEMHKYPTLNQRPAPIVTESFQKSFMAAADGTERAAQLNGLFSNMPKQIEAIRDGKTLSADDMEKAVNHLTTHILGTDVKAFAKDLNSLKTNLLNGQKFLDDESFIALSQAFRGAFDTIYNPNNIRAASMMVQQAGNTVSDASRVANSMGDFFDVTRQTEIALDNLELVATELRANQYIAGFTLEAKKLIKSTKDNPRVAIKLQEHREAFEEGLRISKEKARATIETLKEITKNHPEYRKAFTMAFDLSNGDVHTLDKLFRYAEDNLGIITKGIYDRNPEVPSLILKGLHSARVNSLLSGVSALRAATGNATLITAKPISAFVGSTGAAIGGDTYMFKRALATYGGFTENLQRAMKVMSNDWKLAVANPQEAMRRGRADLNFEADGALEVMEAMQEGFRVEGKEGKVALINIAKGLTFWNNNPIVRWGVNAMSAIDGFTNSMMASGNARARAFDELFAESNGAFKRSEFNKLQRKLYDEAFDANGVLTDKAAKHASSEIALNLDNDLVNGLEVMMRKVPALRSLFLFPRTGLNALEVAWSFTPLSRINIGLTKAQRLFRAQSQTEILESLAEHGIDKMDMIAFRALKSEHTGRQIMGSSIIMFAGLMAVNGQMTGNGPQDPAQKRRMIEMGWKPLSIRNPFTGNWHSYKGFEPYAQLLGIINDVVFHSNRVDQAPLEDIGGKLAAAISLNVTNSTFLSGFEPLYSLMAGDETAWARFTADNINSMLPFAGGRNLLSQVITPQLKDVETEWQYYLANRNKYLFNDQVLLPDALDIYTGEPIKYQEPLTAAINALLPAFKTNGGMEPWRQWMLSTGWDGLQILQKNPLSGQPITPEAQQWLNNWIGAGLKNKDGSPKPGYPLVKLIEEMRNHPQNYWDKKVKEYKKALGNQEQSEFPIKQLVVHRELDRIHRQARKAAWIAYGKTQEGKAATLEGHMKQDIKNRLRKGDVQGALDKQAQYLDIINIAK